jgi:hypothetical protein
MAVLSGPEGARRTLRRGGLVVHVGGEIERVGALPETRA